MKSRHCHRSGRFSWARKIDDEGCLTYRLFWRDASGRVYMDSKQFSPFADRRDIARELRRLRHNARVMREALRIAA